MKKRILAIFLLLCLSLAVVSCDDMMINTGTQESQTVESSEEQTIDDVAAEQTTDDVAAESAGNGGISVKDGDDETGWGPLIPIG